MKLVGGAGFFASLANSLPYGRGGVGSDSSQQIDNVIDPEYPTGYHYCDRNGDYNGKEGEYQYA